MSGDGNDDVKIPVVFLFSNDANILLKAITTDPELEVNNIYLFYIIKLFIYVFFCVIF